MKYSIKKKLFVNSILITFLSFFLILVCFNYITGNYIEKETVEELKDAISTIKKQSGIVLLRNREEVINKMVEAIKEKNNTETSNSDKTPPPNLSSKPPAPANNIRLAPNVEFIVLNSGGDIIFPMDIAISDSIKNHYRNEAEITELKLLLENNMFLSPERITLSDRSYYILETKLGEDLRIVCYKNTQSLDDLVKNINFVLFLLLMISSALNVILNIGLTKGIISSINKLCEFANEIGKGNWKKKNLNLKEKELAVLEEDMNKMAVKLSEYDSEQKLFFQNVSHELRTPLMSIGGYAEGITNHVFKDEKIDEAAGIIINESLRLTEMVNNLLRISRMDVKGIKTVNENINIQELIDEAVESMGGILGEKEIIIENDEVDFIVLGSYEELKQGIINILTNCIRHCNSKIIINTVGKDRKITISDDGEGFRNKDLPNIFKRFYKGDGGCIGIGLSITESIVKNHGGEISAFNDNGAVFLIKFPKIDRR